MKADSPASKPSRALSSSEVERLGGAAPPLARRPITCSACSVDFFGAGEDLSAGALDQRIDQNHVALVAAGLDLDRACFFEAFRLVDHLVPGFRRLFDEVFAVPEQLRVGVERGRVEL